MKGKIPFVVSLAVFLIFSIYNVSALSTIVQFTEFEGNWYSFLKGQVWNCSHVSIIYANEVELGSGWSNCNLENAGFTCNASEHGCPYCVNSIFLPEYYGFYIDDLLCGANYPPSDAYTTCRNCDGSNINVIQIWYNNTGTCTDVTNILTAFKNGNKTISMVSLDTDVCSNTDTVPAVSSNYVLRGNIPTTSIWNPSSYSCKDDVFLLYPNYNGSKWSNCNMNNYYDTCNVSSYGSPFEGCYECCAEGTNVAKYIEDIYGCSIVGITCNYPPIGDLKKNRLIYYNSSSGDENNLYLTVGDVIGLNLRFDTNANHTKILDKNSGQVTTNSDTYVVNFTVSNSRIQFYIANKNPKTIWADEVVVKNTLKWSYLSNLDAIYTTHGQQRIDVSATYNPSTDTITVRPIVSNQKIPIETATGSNSLFITGSFVSAFFTAVVIGIGFGIAGLLTLMTLFFGIGGTSPRNFIEIMVGATIIITILSSIIISII